MLIVDRWVRSSRITVIASELSDKHCLMNNPCPMNTNIIMHKRYKIISPRAINAMLTFALPFVPSNGHVHRITSKIDANTHTPLYGLHSRISNLKLAYMIRAITVNTNRNITWYRNTPIPWVYTPLLLIILWFSLEKSYICFFISFWLIALTWLF